MQYKVAIDMRYVENNYSGLSRFSTNIFENLLRNSNYNITYLVLLPPKNIVNKLDLFLKLNSSKIVKIYSKNKRGLRWKIPFFIFDFHLYRKLKKENVDIFISPYIDPPILPGIQVISTIHDLIFLRVNNYFNNFSLIKKFVSELRIFLTILYSNNLLTVSNATKKILIKRYEKMPFFYQKLRDITVIYNGISLYRSEQKYSGFKNNLLHEEYFLYVGDRRNHKNLLYTIELVKKYNIFYKKDYKLIIAGSNSYKNYKLIDCINSHKFVKEVLNPSDQLLDFLYRKCLSLIFLSFDEGFGIPVIEAAARCSKTILSDIPVFREIAPKSALFLDLDKKKNHLKLLNEYINKNIKIDTQFILKKWTWEESSLKLEKLLLSKLTIKK